MRWLRTTLVTLVVLFLLAVAGRYYLASKHMATNVAARLETLCGGPVEVGDMDVGFDGSVMHGLRLFDTSTTLAMTVPWAVVSEARADTDLWSLLSGESTPRKLTLVGAAVVLQFDRDGQLVTRLPTGGESGNTLPDIDVEQGQFTLRQDGRPDLVLVNITASLRSDGQLLTFAGTINDPRWGDWTAKGTATWPFRSATLDLETSAPVHLTQEMLSALPFVPEKTWRHVQADGDTTAAIHLAADAGKPLHYRLDLHPRNTKVHVTKIDLDGASASGQVIVEDEVVHLRDVCGRTASGTIGTKSDMDFRRRPYVLTFAVTGNDVDVQGLPKTWGLPRLLTGRATGQVDLRLEVEVDASKFTGEGEGQIDGARFAGVPANSMRMRVFNEGSGFRFQPLTGQGKN